jgi:hypothetical protein
VTIGQAEAHGAVFPHDVAPAAVQPVFVQPRLAGSSAERKCVGSLSDAPLPLGSWRSGEFITRTVFAGRYGLRAGKGSKVLWMPLHDPGSHRVPLLIRAARLEHPADTVRLTFSASARGVRSREFGFPSTVRFPASGRSLLVATTGKDWGCFLLDVAE